MPRISAFTPARSSWCIWAISRGLRERIRLVDEENRHRPGTTSAAPRPLRSERTRSNALVRRVVISPTAPRPRAVRLNGYNITSTLTGGDGLPEHLSEFGPADADVPGEHEERCSLGHRLHGKDDLPVDGISTRSGPMGREEQRRPLQARRPGHRVRLAQRAVGPCRRSGTHQPFRTARRYLRSCDPPEDLSLDQNPARRVPAVASPIAIR